jgi:hypothetical protein
MSNNNGTGFWVIIGLIAALSFVAIVEAAIAVLRAPVRHLAVTLRRALRARAGGRKAGAAGRS